MEQKLSIDPDEAVAAVKLRGRWRLFYDVETMFLLNYSAYHPDYIPEPGCFRYNTLIVDENNAELWMSALAGELTLEQIPYTYWGDTSQKAKLTFVIDFDQKLWVGEMWQHDQTWLPDYQPEGWTAIEDEVIQYLPSEIRSYWEQGA
jgi:hypothetical protein